MKCYNITFSGEEPSFTSPFVGRSKRIALRVEVALPVGTIPPPEKSFATLVFFDLPTEGEVKSPFAVP